MTNIPIARCLAKLCCDGNVYLGNLKGSRPYIRYNNTCLELLEEFEKDMRALFTNITLTKGITNTGTPFITNHKKEIAKYFLNYLPDFRSQSIFVPEIIRNAKINEQRAFIRSAFDDEGSVKIRIFEKTNEWKRNISFTSNSLRFLSELKTMLEDRFSINSNKIYQDRKCYTFEITGKENFVLFDQKIGFSHPIKSERLKLLLKTYDARASDKKRFAKLYQRMIELRKMAEQSKNDTRIIFQQLHHSSSDSSL